MIVAAAHAEMRRCRRRFPWNSRAGLGSGNHRRRRASHSPSSAILLRIPLPRGVDLVCLVRGLCDTVLVSINVFKMDFVAKTGELLDRSPAIAVDILEEIAQGASVVGGLSDPFVIDVSLSSPLDATKQDALELTVSSRYGSGAITDALTETDIDSNIFLSADHRLWLQLSDISGFGAGDVDSMTATVVASAFSPRSAISKPLEETGPSTLEFISSHLGVTVAFSGPLDPQIANEIDVTASRDGGLSLSYHLVEDPAEELLFVEVGGAMSLKITSLAGADPSAPDGFVGELTCPGLAAASESFDVGKIEGPGLSYSTSAISVSPASTSPPSVLKPETVFRVRLTDQLETAESIDVVLSTYGHEWIGTGDDEDIIDSRDVTLHRVADGVYESEEWFAVAVGTADGFEAELEDVEVLWGGLSGMFGSGCSTSKTPTYTTMAMKEYGDADHGGKNVFRLGACRNTP